MAKAQTFSDKIAKAQQRKDTTCPECGAVVSWVKVVDPIQGPTGGFRFRSRVEKICKCTNADLMTR
jgi:hypothetical protein